MTRNMNHCCSLKAPSLASANAMGMVLFVLVGKFRRWLHTLTDTAIS